MWCDSIEVCRGCQLVGFFKLESLSVCHAHIHAELERDSLIDLINEKGDAAFAAVAENLLANQQSAVKVCDLLLLFPVLAFLVGVARLSTFQDAL